MKGGWIEVVKVDRFCLMEKGMGEGVEIGLLC